MWTDIVDKTAGFVARNGELTSWKFLFYYTVSHLLSMICKTTNVTYKTRNKSQVMFLSK